MGYRAYPEMRDSGVEWIKRIPAHWHSKRLKFSVSLINEKVEAESSELSYMGLEHIESWSGKRIEDSTASSEGVATKFLPKDVLFGKLRPYLAKVHLASHEGLASTEALILRSQPEVSAAYLRYFLVSKDFINIVDSSTYGSKMPRASWDFIGNLPMLHPSLPEQQTIARFLDHKTAQIDALIAKKEALLQKLAEKRTSLISQAVTQGLDPTVPMQDSGVAWLGAIPTHWTVKPVKFVGKIGNGSTPSRDKADYWTDGTYPWLNSSVVNQETVTEAADYVTETALLECHLPIITPPAILIGITGQGKTRGMASTLAFEATINQHIAYVKPTTDDMDINYLRRIFDRAYSFLRNESDGGGSTKGAITCEQIASLKLPFPPLQEQKQIAAFADFETRQMSEMVQKVETAIERLKEYRSALISAAVTGKIDVREFQNKSSSRSKT